MSTIQERRDNLLTLTEGILVHGCNAQGVMGSGFAKGLRAKYPGAFTAYKHKYDRRGLAVGEVVYYEPPMLPGAPKLVIANAITQKFYGRDPNILYVSYDGLERCFEDIGKLARQTGLAVHFPLIGAGLANGKWEEIAPRIERALGPDVDKHLWIYEP